MSNKAIVKGTNLTKSQKAKNRAAFLKEEGVNDKINSIAESMGVSPDEILHAIEKETAGSYSPAQKNLAGGSAVGLIQFVGTGTDKGKGGKTVNGTFYKSSDLEAMTTLEQLDVVEGYFTENFKNKGGKPGQIYNSIAAPSSVGKAGDKVIYAAGSDAAEQNPGWQNDDGSVTTDSMANFGGSPEFFTYTPQVAGVSQDIKQPENKLSKNEQEVIDLQTSKRNNINISNAFTEPSDDEKEKLKKSVISIGSQIQSDVDAGTLKGDDDAILKEFMKRIQKEAGFEGIDITNAEEVGKARGIIDFVTKTANEDLGESIRGGVFDSKIEDVFEDNANNAKNNLLSLGIPSKGTYLIEEKTPLDILRQEGIEGGKAIRPVGITEKLETRNNILQLINDDPDLNSKMVSSGLTPEEFADTLVDGVESADKASNSATQEEKEEAVTRHETRLADAISEYTPEEVVEEVVEDTTEVDAVNELKDKRSRQMAMAEKALTGLKAAAGLTSLSKALQEPDIKTPQVSSLMLEALGKQKKLSTMGLNAAEKASAMQGINEAYSGAIKNVLGASGGQRGSFLANQGVADANRVKGLLQLSAQDAAVRRQNVGQYNQLASSVGQMQLSADMSAEQMKQQAIAQNKQMLGGIGTNLLSDAISDATYYLNPNREHMDEMMKQYMESTTSNNSYTPPTETDVIGTNNPSMTDKERKAEVARLALEKKNNTI